MRPRSHASGFTLIELMVTLAIFAILAALAAPSFGKYFADQRLKGVVGEMISDLQFARMESVQRNVPVTVAFSSTGYSISSGGNTVKAVSLGAGSSVSGGSTMSASFDPVRATATLTNGPDVIIANSKTSSTLRVTLSTMGRVTVCSPGGAMKGYDTCS
jgi:type IV fimbrial biogenesis protein FimT